MKIFESGMVQFNGYFHYESVSTFKQRLETFLWKRFLNNYLT